MSSRLVAITGTFLVLSGLSLLALALTTCKPPAAGPAPASPGLAGAPLDTAGAPIAGTTDVAAPAVPSTTAQPTDAAPPAAPVSTAGPAAGPKAAPRVTAAASPEAEPILLTVVYDNKALDTDLRSGWGFAAWLEYGRQTVLLDTGPDGRALLHNVAALGLDPHTIDIVVLSHNHADHTAGLDSLLAVKAPACAERGECLDVYLPQAFPTRFKEQIQAAGARVVEVKGPHEILPGLWSTGQMGTGIVEQALIVKTGQGLVVVTGCAHPGAQVMVARAKEVGGGDVDLVVGGFHLASASRARVAEIVAEFRQLGVKNVAPCHCTGDEAGELFRRAYGQDYYACGVGWQWPQQGPAWRLAGQGIPGQVGVAAVAIAPGDHRVVYLAAYEPGGLYRSGDGGDTWQPARGGLGGLSPLAIAVHPQEPAFAWVGTVAGAYRTSDAGQSWQPMAGVPAVPIYALAVRPDGATLLAGGEETGIGRSDDGGRVWTFGPAGNGPDTVLALAVTPGGSLLAGSAGQGLWQSEDEGQGWQPVNGGLAQGYVPQVATLDDSRWYALAGGSLSATANAGQSWQTVGPAAFEVLSFTAESVPDGRLYVGSRGEGVATSLDAGRSWVAAGGELRHADITCLVADPAVSGRAFLGTRYNGLYRTDDGGATWTLVSGGIGRPLVTSLAQDTANTQILYAGAPDGVYRSEDGGAQWRLVTGQMGMLNVQGLAVGPAGEQVYAGTLNGIYVSRDRAATWRWAQEDTGRITVFNIVVDPGDASRIYAGSWGHNVLVSSDAGNTWSPLHHGLETLSVHAFALDPTNPRRLYAGTVEAVYRSADGGESWLASAPADRPLSILALLVDPRRPARIYAGTTEGVYLSTDSGQTWQAAGHESLGATVTALALIMDDGLLPLVLAGTEHQGLYRSTDGGALWQPWGLETASVYAILVDGSGGVWAGTDQGLFRDR